MEQIEHLLESFRVLPHVAALAFAYVLALPTGWDRERNERSAGLRTFPLVAVASCGFVQATEGITGNSPEPPPRLCRMPCHRRARAASRRGSGAGTGSRSPRSPIITEGFASLLPLGEFGARAFRGLTGGLPRRSGASTEQAVKGCPAGS
jgi:hypothetical protein